MSEIATLSPEILAFIEAVPDLYLVLSPDLRILTASKAYLKITQYKLEEIQGSSVFDVFPDNPDLIDSNSTINLRNSLEWVVQHKEPHQMKLQRYDVQLPPQSGVFKEKYWLPVNTPVLDKERNLIYILHKVEDATEEVLAKKRLEASEHQLEQIQEEQVFTKKELYLARVAAEMERSKLHNLLMQSPAMICILEGPQHVFAFVNPPYQQLVGERPLLGKPILEAMPELADQSIIGLLDKVYQTGESFYAFEMKVQLDHTNTGGLGENYYNFTYQAIRNQKGVIYGITVFAYEVTAQVEARQEVEERGKVLQTLNEQLKAANRETATALTELSQAQQALRELNQELEERIETRTRELEHSKAATEIQRNRLEHLFMEAPIPFLILDGPEHIFQLINPAFQQIFPGREMQDKPLLQALPELKETPIPDFLTQVYQTGENYVAREFPLMLARHEGSPLEEILFTFTYQARRNEEGAVDGILVYAHDVTEQVKARQVVEQSAERLQLITDALPVLIGYLDKDEKYRFANKAYEAWFPLKSEDLLGRHVRDVVGDKAYSGVKKYIDRALAGERLDFESRMPYREDFIKYIQTSYIPEILDEKVAGFYTLVTDVTDQVLARLKIEEREKLAHNLTRELAATNDNLTSANAQLVRTNIDLDNFIYTASHDLKAPINNIEGLVRIMQQAIPEKVLATDELQQVIGMTEDSFKRFKRTIDHLTEVIKLQKENNQEMAIVNLAEVVEDVKLDLSPQLKAAGAQLTIDVEGCPPIHFSHKNMRSVVYNLLSNAIKYCSPDRTPEIHISCYTEGEDLVLSVKDNGLGISQAGRRKLFSMFERLHDHVEGSGIGLYMVKKIVENAEGRIEVESEVNVGSTFRVYLKP